MSRPTWILFLALAYGVPAWAGNVQVRLLSDRAAVTPGAPFRVGIRFQIRPGWHIYWKNPGDSGLPPKIMWNLPKGFSAGPIEWPVPERFEAEGLMSYGYAHEVVLPVEITPPSAVDLDSVRIAGKLEWLECADVCLAGSSPLSLTLPVSRSPVKVEARAWSLLPVDPLGWSLSAVAGPRAIALDFMPPAGIAPHGGYLFVDQPLVAEYDAPQGFQRTPTGYRLTLQPAANASGNPARLSGVLVVKGSAIRVDVPVKAGDPVPAPVPSKQRPWPAAAITAVSAIAVLIIVRRARRASVRT